MKFPQLTQKQKYICYTIWVVCISFVIWDGFGETTRKIVQCVGVSSKWVEADYSDTSVTIDSEGYTSIETDYWSEPASDVYTITTIDGVVQHTPINYTVDTFGIAIPNNWPDTDLSLSKNIDFDGFTNKYSEQYTVHFDDSDTVSESKSFNNMCIIYMNSEKDIVVKIWYGIKYGVSIK